MPGRMRMPPCSRSWDCARWKPRSRFGWRRNEEAVPGGGGPAAGRGGPRAAGYATSARAYPVLYLLDGGLDQDFVHIVGTSQLGGAWGRQQEAIVVGIESKDRRSELVGPTRDPALLAKYPTAGHSAEFRRFVRQSVKPFVAAHFRTNGQDGVIGESLAGLFVVETWLREPDLFGAYAAISPSLWWDGEALTREAAALVGPRQAGKRLYLATANE